MKKGFDYKLAAWIERYEFLIMVWLAAILLRLPNIFEPYWYGDEGIYLTVGQALRRGIGLYAGIMDHKTPIIYWLAELAGTLLRFKLLLLVSSLISIGLFYALAQKLFKNTLAKKLAVIAFMLLTVLPRFEGNVVNGELILMPFVLAGVLLWWKVNEKKTPTWQQLFWSGMFFGLAILTKVPAGVDFLAILIYLGLFNFEESKRNRVKNKLMMIVMLILGCITPIGLSLVYFLLKGTGKEYIQYGLLYNLWYIGAWGSPFSHPVAIFLASLKGRLVLLLGFVIGCWIGRKRLTKGLIFSLLWFGLALFGALLSLRPYPHYLLQLMPPTALLLGYMIQSKYKQKILIGCIFVLALGVVSTLNFYPYPTRAYYKLFIDYMSGKINEDEYRVAFDSNVPGSYIVAQYIREHTDTDERIFIWGDEPVVYALAQRSPATKYTSAFHVESLNGFEETLAQISAMKPRYIFDSYKKYESFPGLYQLLEMDYVRLKPVNRMEVYRRLP